ncbi:MAG: 16S rRNA processing protein RimM [Clostridia bacterium]|nr:16S rRNA processing protein RimM [Clostridia bacterium]
MKQKYIEQGYISGTHGVRGEVKLVVWCDDTEDFFKLKSLYLDGEGKKKLEILSSHGSKNGAVVKFAGVDTVEDAARLKGITVYVDRADLHIPEDRILICDLIGLPVVDADSGKIYGTLGSVEEYPASDIYMVKTENGTVQVPDVPQFIKKLTDEAIYITPIKGMFE